MDFPRPSQYQPGRASSTSSFCCLSSCASSERPLSLDLHPQSIHADPSRLLRRNISAAASASSLSCRDDNLQRKPSLSTYAVAGCAKERGPAAAVGEAKDGFDGQFVRNGSETFPAPTEIHADRWVRRWGEGWGWEARISRRATLGHSTSKSGNNGNRLEQPNASGEKREDEQPNRPGEEEEGVEERRRSTAIGPQRRAPMPTGLVGRRWRAREGPRRALPPAGHFHGYITNNDVRGDGSGCEEKGTGWGRVCGEDELGQGDLGVQGVRNARDDALQVSWCACDRWCKPGSLHCYPAVVKLEGNSAVPRKSFVSTNCVCLLLVAERPPSL